MWDAEYPLSLARLAGAFVNPTTMKIVAHNAKDG